MQYCPQEMEKDSKYIFDLATKTDLHFNQIKQSLTHSGAKNAVIAAFNFLYTSNGPNKEGWQAYLNSTGYLVISLLQHLLVRLLTKKMMNLMMTEALILKCSKIPYTYLENYLESQFHFCFKEVIANYHKALIE